MLIDVSWNGKQEKNVKGKTSFLRISLPCFAFSTGIPEINGITKWRRFEVPGSIFSCSIFLIYCFIFPLLFNLSFIFEAVKYEYFHVLTHAYAIQFQPWILCNVFSSKFVKEIYLQWLLKIYKIIGRILPFMIFLHRTVLSHSLAIIVGNRSELLTRGRDHPANREFQRRGTIESTLST